jgi:hypothetical protein
MVGMITRQCERCRKPVTDQELSLTRRQFGYMRRLHVGCLAPLEQRAMFVTAGGLPCLFCSARGLTLRQLIDHFGAEHGRVIVNW